MNKKLTIGSGIALLAAIVALGSTLNLWMIFGWTTPEAHTQDVQHIEDHAKKTEQAIVEFQDRWQCDEWTEELNDLLALVNATPLDNERIRRLRKKIDDKECFRFDD